MKKTYQLENLDCAACAAKIENALRGIKGVRDVSVSFIAQKLTIESDTNPDSLLPEVLKLIDKIEPDCGVIL